MIFDIELCQKSLGPGYFAMQNSGVTGKNTSCATRPASSCNIELENYRFIPLDGVDVDGADCDFFLLLPNQNGFPDVGCLDSMPYFSRM